MLFEFGVPKLTLNSDSRLLGLGFSGFAVLWA